MVDIKKIEASLPVIYKTGKMLLGANNVRWALKNEPDKVKVVIIARNTPKEFEDEFLSLIKLTGRNIPLIRVSKTNIELGDLCGRPHSISSLVIYDFGSAPISEDIFHG